MGRTRMVMLFIMGYRTTDEENAEDEGKHEDKHELSLFCIDLLAFGTYDWIKVRS
jgi:hypothetical protein